MDTQTSIIALPRDMINEIFDNTVPKYLLPFRLTSRESNKAVFDYVQCWIQHHEGGGLKTHIDYLFAAAGLSRSSLIVCLSNVDDSTFVEFVNKCKQPGSPAFGRYNAEIIKAKIKLLEL